MKSTIFAVLMFAAVAGNAADVGVDAAFDPNAHRTGVRVEGGVDLPVVGGVDASVTRIGGDYDRFAVGKSLEFAKLGQVSFKLDGDGVYQRSDVGRSGYGLTVGSHAELAVYKNIVASVGIERFAGEHKLRADNGSVLLAGVSFNF